MTRKHKLIAFTGPAGSGKTTAAHMTGFRRLRFAQPLKDMLRAFGLTEAQIDGDEKEIAIPGLGCATPRFLMQTLGTEWGRNSVDPDLWVKHMRLRLDDILKVADVVIDDVRFENEAAMIREMGGTIVHICGRGGIEGDHPSENGIKLHPDLGDKEVYNDDTQATLHMAVKKLIKPNVYGPNCPTTASLPLRVTLDGEVVLDTVVDTTIARIVEVCPSEGWVTALRLDDLGNILFDSKDNEIVDRLEGDVTLEVLDESGWRKLT